MYGPGFATWYEDGAASQSYGPVGLKYVLAEARQHNDQNHGNRLHTPAAEGMKLEHGLHERGYLIPWSLPCRKDVRGESSSVSSICQRSLLRG